MKLPFIGTALPLLVGATSTPHGRGHRPNIIVMQPDDLQFYDEWSPPPNNPMHPDREKPLPPVPNIERLRTGGVWMKQAYTVSPMCGTSRYSTITGKYPSRASSNRASGAGCEGIANVTIPRTKLTDREGQNDCSVENLGAQLKISGHYRTGMIGKWHLSPIKDSDYTYELAVTTVKGCGFDYVGGLYLENLVKKEKDIGNYYDGTFSHNMEWITYEAINFIYNATEAGEPFFLYFNPTVPHGANSVRIALEDFSCRNTSNGDLGFDPIIPGMTDHGNCTAYRETIFARASDEDEMGAIWIDDSIGAVMQALDEKGILNETIFLFQLDHGMETKGALYENGIRIAQFVHYPAEILAGIEFKAPVSTLDIGPTLLDYAGLVSAYNMDGKSWKDAIHNKTAEALWSNSRCLYFENEIDRAVRCGCRKFLKIMDSGTSSTYRKGGENGYANEPKNLFDLCGGTDVYVTNKATNMEANNTITKVPAIAQKLADAIECHLARTNIHLTPDYLSCDPSFGFKTFTPSESEVPSAVSSALPFAKPSLVPTVSMTSTNTCPYSLKQPEKSCKKASEGCCGVCDKNGVGRVAELPKHTVWPKFNARCKNWRRDGTCKKFLLQRNFKKDMFCPKKTSLHFGQIPNWYRYASKPRGMKSKNSADRAKKMRALQRDH